MDQEFFESDSDNRKVLENARASLRPGGKLVVDVMGKEILARVYEPVGSVTLPGVGTQFQRRALVDAFKRVDNEWTFVFDDDSVKRFRLTHWIYSARELESMLIDAGFADVRLFGNLAGDPYQPGARRLVAVATRGASAEPG